MRGSAPARSSRSPSVPLSPPWKGSASTLARSRRGSDGARAPASASPLRARRGRARRGAARGQVAELAARVPFPSAWRVLLIFDAATQGLAGASEKAAFGTLPDLPAREIAALSRAVTQGALPALAAGDFAAFCRHVGAAANVHGRLFRALARRRLCQPAGRRLRSASSARKGSSGLGRVRGDRPALPSSRTKRKARLYLADCGIVADIPR